MDKESTDTTVPEPEKKGHYSDYEDIHTVHRKPGAHTHNDYDAVTTSHDDQSEALAAAAKAHKEEKTSQQPVSFNLTLSTSSKNLNFNIFYFQKETIKSYSDDYVMDGKE